MPNSTQHCPLSRPWPQPGRPTFHSNAKPVASPTRRHPRGPSALGPGRSTRTKAVGADVCASVLLCSVPAVSSRASAARLAVLASPLALPRVVSACSAPPPPLCRPCSPAWPHRRRARPNTPPAHTPDASTSRSQHTLPAPRRTARPAEPPKALYFYPERPRQPDRGCAPHRAPRGTTLHTPRAPPHTSPHPHLPRHGTHPKTTNKAATPASNPPPPPPSAPSSPSHAAQTRPATARPRHPAPRHATATEPATAETTPPPRPTPPPPPGTPTPKNPPHPPPGPRRKSAPRRPPAPRRTPPSTPRTPPPGTYRETDDPPTAPHNRTLPRDPPHSPASRPRPRHLPQSRPPFLSSNFFIDKHARLLE
ncbi:unnamed protein product [Gadus morhua 'NCC']